MAHDDPRRDANEGHVAASSLAYEREPSRMDWGQGVKDELQRYYDSKDRVWCGLCSQAYWICRKFGLGPDASEDAAHDATEHTWSEFERMLPDRLTHRPGWFAEVHQRNCLDAVRKAGRPGRRSVAHFTAAPSPPVPCLYSASSKRIRDSRAEVPMRG
jgi:hypothetical protein